MNRISGDAISLLSATEAAKLLGIGKRLLWSMTNSGEIPHVKIRRRVLYRTDQIQAFIDQQTKGEII
jgi:excisionase family DNA binding protein